MEDRMTSLCSIRAFARGFRGALVVSVLGGTLAAGEAAALQTAQTPPAGAQAAPADAAKLSTDQLESLVAPLALYPDPLLAQCLVASTYPLDIVAAQQWLDKNSTLKGEALTKAAQEQSWDPSVQALVEIPDALKRLSENIEWTTDLGDAFLAQEQEVMDAVQSMRKKAKDSGKLETTKEQKVETTVVENKTVIEIQPSSTEVVYVPSYSPTVVWGAPYYPYPPMYYPPYYGGAWLGFGVGIAVGIGISGGWGWGCGWGHNDVNINVNNNNNFVNNHNRQNNVNRSGNSSWNHDAKQRGGAPYKDKATASKYGGGARGDSPQARSSQAQSRQASGNRASTGSMDRGGSSGSRGGTSAGSMDRGGSSGSMDRGGSSSMGSRNVPSSSSSSRSSGGFSGGSGSSARSSSSRGHSSMGGGSRGGGGGGRRR
jgi:hypothetical protein